MDYLAACAIYRDEASYLQEWLEFHRLVGVQRFFLYNNRSTDDHRFVLEPYIADRTVVLKDWPEEPGQLNAYRDCLAEHRGAARWIAFIDLDEFLFSPTFMSLPEVLVAYERWPGVYVNWAAFGPSGHDARPDGLVIQAYTLRAPANHMFNRWCKCVVDPARTVGLKGVHAFHFRDGPGVDENFTPMEESLRGQTPKSSWERLRINHYQMKSRQQWMEKVRQPRADSGLMRQYSTDRLSQALDDSLSRVFDDTIQTYVPALQAALANLSRIDRVPPSTTARPGR
jgi:Glycosyltransferase family 92